MECLNELRSLYKGIASGLRKNMSPIYSWKDSILAMLAGDGFRRCSRLSMSFCRKTWKLIQKESDEDGTQILCFRQGQKRIGKSLPKTTITR